jgi:acetylornithine/LysW-gamma-L-lysine aminotransferase
MTNYGVNILGYRHSALDKALAAQIEALPTLHCSFANDVRVRASRALLKRLGGDYEALYWANSGAEAIEAALKFAVLATRKKKFVACRNGYHGKTLGALSATHGAKYRAHFEPLLWEFVHVDFDDPSQLEERIDRNTAAFIVEPAQGEAGVLFPRDGYLRAVGEICANKGVLLILDEIQTGCGRTGRFLASGREGVRADILCLGKGLAGGIPVGVAAVSAEVARAISKGAQTSTFGGNPLACAGVLAVLDALTDELLARVEDLGSWWIGFLKTVSSPAIKEIRGRGLMIGVEVEGDRDRILRDLQRNKILAIPAGDDVVRFLPPYIVDKQQLVAAADTLAGVLAG